jgi:tripartite-type tricarboxylate transporter receptor subunit TctC
VIGGQVDMMFDTLLVVGPHIQSGKLRPIAVSSSKRVESLPNVPTIAEAGQKGFDVGSWQAVFAPAGTPKPIVDRLHAEIMKIVATPEVQTRLKSFGMVPSTMTPAELGEYQKAEVAKWAQVIKSAGIKAD